MTLFGLPRQSSRSVINTRTPTRVHPALEKMPIYSPPHPFSISSRSYIYPPPIVYRYAGRRALSLIILRSLSLSHSLVLARLFMYVCTRLSARSRLAPRTMTAGFLIRPDGLSSRECQKQKSFGATTEAYKRGRREKEYMCT